MNDSKNKTQDVGESIPTTSETQGRIPAESNQEHKKDISHVDQQEGHMDNGELGGNFNEDAPDVKPQ